MKKENSKFEYSVYIILALLAIIFIGVGIFLTYQWKAEENILLSKIIPFTLSELGIAVIISLILIFTIESFSRKRHTKAANNLMEGINNNLFKSVFNRYIPDQVFSEVEKCLLCTDIVREQYEIEYHLSHISSDVTMDQEDKENHLVAEISSAYKLQNITEKKIEFPVETHIELPIDHSMHDFVKFNSFRVNSENIDLTDPKILENNIEKTDSHLILTYQVNIDPNSSVSISCTMKTIKRTVDMEVWSSRLPSDGLTLRVTTPDNITVQATANHSEKLEKIITPGTTKQWKLNYGIFPFQSVIFWWKA